MQILQSLIFPNTEADNLNLPVFAKRVHRLKPAHVAYKAMSALEISDALQNIEKELQNNGEGVLRFLGGFHGEQRGRHTGTMRRQKTNDPANHKGRLYLHRLADHALTHSALLKMLRGLAIDTEEMDIHSSNSTRTQ